MASAVHLQTAVGTGGRVEFVLPELPEGRMVEVFVVDTGKHQPSPNDGLVAWLKSLTPRRTLSEWAQFERDFQEERNSWDR
jgi:hypothetical protein